MMNIADKVTFEIQNELRELIGEVSAKGVFNGYGIFHKKLMFGLYQDNHFYLRGVGKLAIYLEEQGAISYMEHTDTPAIYGDNYYLLTEKIRQNKKLYKSLVLWSIEQVESEQKKKALSKEGSIKNLINLSIKHERLLHKIDVDSVETFFEVGPAHCYIELRKRGFSVNLAFFWSLTAAYLNKHFTLLTQEEKDNALELLNDLLANEGMRQVNLIKD
ncbi:TfoX/Sxy family DNA transformation protein [Avibacterium paragallinarum]|uniref:Regulator of competence-specific genes n=1 Tax=Avibacterium paragallinarum TaxID=728 RepID=A0A380Z2S1_AVIPA|nr:TfoX/Sxy family DNA transformation protein [Avibacterium paragallinarum]SUV40528.1 Regulator of competence-specific genes [Avibacterium paragallinarum]